MTNKLTLNEELKPFFENENKQIWDLILNYNACIYGDGVPVTLKFADSIGEILTAGKDIKTGVLPFKHYI